MKAMVVCVLFASGFLVQSCRTSAELTNEWRDPVFTQPAIRTMLVLAIKKDPAIRRLWEDKFVTEFSRYGVTATPSYRLFPDRLPDTNQIVNAVRQNKYDGILLINRVRIDTTITQVPGYYSREPVDAYNYWTDWYYTYYEDVYHPGYVETARNVFNQINVYSTSGRGQMIWTGTAEVTDPNSVADVNSEVVRRVIPELADQQIIPQK